jgi:hypothetical protein
LFFIKKKRRKDIIFLRRKRAMKRILSVLLAVAMIASSFLFVSCAKEEEKADAFKLGVICLHDEKSTYDLNFIQAVEKAAADLGLKEDQVIFKKNIPEQRISNYYWMSILKEWNDKGIDYDKEYENAVSSITAEKVISVLKSVVDSGNYVEIIMSPEE